MKRAAQAGASIIGINNRDLTTFMVDIETSIRLAQSAPGDAILVSESGLKTQADTCRVHAAGCQAILVGESLMRTGDIAAQVKALLDVDPAPGL